jgi:hypothetical protein
MKEESMEIKETTEITARMVEKATKALEVSSHVVDGRGFARGLPPL